MWFQNRRTKWRKKTASEPSSTQTVGGDGVGDASENEVEDEEYNKPLDPHLYQAPCHLSDSHRETV